MKRTLTFVICIVTLLSFYSTISFAENEKYDYFYFGHYQQQLEINYVSDQAIEWLVLEDDEENGKALLISNYALDLQPFDTEKQPTSWSNSFIRHWLNDEFYNAAFSEEEKSWILTTTVKNDKSETPSDSTMAENKDTEDKVFLLSASEYQKYFADDERCPYTLHVQELANMIIKDTGTYWLRSPGKKSGEFNIAGNGKIGSRSTNKASGIRPAIWIDYNGDDSTLPFSRMLDAIDLEENGKYLEAFDIYDELGFYEYGYYCAAGTMLEYAAKAEEEKDYDAAISKLDKYQEYCATHDLEMNEDYFSLSSSDILNNSCYNLAIISQEKGEYEKAIELYSRVGQYKDSMPRLISCFEEAKILYKLISSEQIDLKNAGINTDYANTDKIKKGDPHNGWSLGEFLISGFTDYEDGIIPVFFKKPGDNMALWFKLDQNIDALHGNKNLTIVADKKGFDNIFQYPPEPTNFGRGALLVRHITTTKENTNIYVNYLAAKLSDNANTHIDIKEEGTYIIALDYLIKNRDLSKALKSTTGYRMTFKFIVKNAKAFGYFIELDTNAVLEDYSRTEKGFRIDFANSKTLQADVIRYVITQSGKGLDARTNERASEKDKFDKTGYYIITITNKETGSFTEKHIFVGDQSDLEMFIEAEPTLDKFRN